MIYSCILNNVDTFHSSPWSSWGWQGAVLAWGTRWDSALAVFLADSSAEPRMNWAHRLCSWAPYAILISTTGTTVWPLTGPIWVSWTFPYLCFQLGREARFCWLNNARCSVNQSLKRRLHPSQLLYIQSAWWPAAGPPVRAVGSSQSHTCCNTEVAQMLL